MFPGASENETLWSRQMAVFFSVSRPHEGLCTISPEALV
jgi:hypothetical protein